jgi:thiol-disulfide isomerase/thioredoxin/YHS domain-containing protein
MITVLASIFSLVLTAASFGDMSPAGKSLSRTAGWHTNFAEAQAEAQALGKPLLVHFYADWCGPCQQMERSVLNQPAVLRCLGVEMVGVKINADHHADLKNRFGVSGFPSDVVVSPAGEVSTRFVGATSESSFIARLKREGAKYPSKPDTQLAKRDEEKTEKPAVAIPAADRKHLGLEGYSPVSLTTGKLWKKGNPRYAAKHQGLTYHFASADELEMFEANPARYVPKLLGCDPVILSESGRAVRGKPVHGVFYRNSVFLMATEANREEFLENPAFFADKRFAVEVDEIEQYVRR